jgi:RNA polymerase sigma-70 factor (ECF subfamily)
MDVPRIGLVAMNMGKERAVKQHGPSGSEVFEILAREHADMLVSYLRSLMVRQDAVEDLFQETMLVAWRRLKEYDRSLPFGPWLRGIAGNLVMAHRRKTARGALNCEPEVLAAMEVEFRKFEHEPADSFVQRIERVAGCIEKLPPLLREAVDLVYGRGLSVQAMGTVVQATEEAVKKRVQRARQLVARCVQGGTA